MNIGFQLYSARNTPLADVLPMVARLGYGHVEGYGSLYVDPPALKACLVAQTRTWAGRDAGPVGGAGEPSPAVASVIEAVRGIHRIDSS